MDASSDQVNVPFRGGSFQLESINLSTTSVNVVILNKCQILQIYSGTLKVRGRPWGGSTCLEFKNLKQRLANMFWVSLFYQSVLDIFKWQFHENSSNHPKKITSLFLIEICFLGTSWPSYHIRSYLNAQRCTWPPENVIFRWSPYATNIE